MNGTISNELNAAASKAYPQLLEALRPLASAQRLAIVGIANGGLTLSRWIQRDLFPNAPLGIINSTFHRDDIGFNPISSDFQPTELDFEIDDCTILLVDDVFASGRTLRSALNELFDHGRPREVRFAVLVDTDRRILPLHPDYVGMSCPLPVGPDLKVDFQSDSHIQLSLTPA